MDSASAARIGFRSTHIAHAIRTFSRANDPKVASRMMKIGVNEVICPYQLSGEHVADLIEDIGRGQENIFTLAKIESSV